ncbi:MAG: diguanylate cyclase [Anaerolineaceae bacterium]|nr:diguanylate cyclase [Anaerolineaceae bacterium]
MENRKKNSKRTEFERLITKLSIDFINLSLDDIDSHINMLLAEVGQYVNVDRSYVFIFNPETSTMSNTHEWCNTGIEPQINDLQNLECSSYNYWVSKINKHETILITDLSQLPQKAQELKKTLEEGHVKSLIGIPLVNAGIILGFIGFDSVQLPRTWTDDEINILKIVSGIIGNAIVQYRNQEELHRQRQYLEQLNEITMASLNTKNVEEMVDVVASRILSLIHADNCSIALWDENKQQIIGSAHNGLPSGKKIQSALDQADPSVTQLVLSIGKPLIIEDVSKSEIIPPKLQKLFQTQSLIALPLIVDNQKLGAVIFGFNAIHKFTKSEKSLAQQASYQISQAIFKQRLLENAQKSAQEAEKLHMAGAIVASNLDPNVAISSILDQLAEVVPFDSASIQILNNGFLEIKDGRGWPDHINPVGKRFPIPGDNPNSQVIQSGKPYVLNDAPDIYGIFENKDHSYIRSWLGIPLKVRDHVIGILTLDHSQPNFYDNKQLIDLVTAFADQVAISLENARLYANERRRVDELEALRATTADITRELGLKNLLQAILQRATDLLHATGGELGLVNKTNHTIQILVNHNMGPTDYIGETISMNEGLMGYVAQTQQIEMLEDYKNWDGQMDSYQESPIHAAIAAPLMIGKRFLGVIGIMNSDRTRKFTENEKDLMSMFAQQAAIAVENAQLFEERKHQARVDMGTGIYNRRGLSELGCREIDRSLRFNRPLGVIFLDIDHFKTVNDTYGHAVGDQVLKELAQRLKSNLRSIDILSRYGGEEFVILLPETNAEGALDVAERLRKTVEVTPFSPNDLSLWITISQGVTIMNKDNCSLKELIHQADEAVYQSKDAGRNLVTLYDQVL